MRSKDPKAYWNYVSSLNKTKKKKQFFYEFFKDLNSSLDEDDEPPTAKFPDFSLQNDLNNEITEDEIMAPIKQLKSGKSSSRDDIINEYQKHLINVLLPVYIKLFNLVLCGVLFRTHG